MAVLNRADLLTYVDEHWLTPCDDGMFFSYMRGNVVVEKERQRLHREGKLPQPDQWRPVFLPDVDNSGNLLASKERACFIRRDDESGIPIPSPGRVPSELEGKFQIVTYHHDKGLVDCAHYVSRCLTAGGLPINHPGVPSLVQELQTGKYGKITKTLGEKVTKDQGDRIMATGILKPGDVVAYYSVNHGYSHSAVYTGPDGEGNHRISCHTLSRRNDSFDNAPWSIGNGEGFRFTLIHFGSDDASPPSSIAQHADRWYAVNNGSEAVFYRFFRDGRAEKTRSRPSQNQAHGAGAVSRGYWFVNQPEMVCFWPKDGEIDRVHTTWFADSAPLSSFGLLINNLPAIAQSI